MRWPQVLVSVSTAAAILSIAYGYAGALAFSGILATATWFELFIFMLQLGKVTAILSFKVLRESSPAVLIDIFGIDLVLLPVLALAYLASGSGPIAMLTGQLVRAWMTGAGLAFLVYSAYWVPRSVLRSAPLRTVLPTTFLIAGVGTGLANAASSAATAEGGLGGVVTRAIAPGGSFLGAGLGTEVALGVIYMSLLAYALVAWSSGAGVRLNYGLLAAVLATAGTTGWIFSFGSLAPYIPLVLLPPILLVAGFSWWIGRTA